MLVSTLRHDRQHCLLREHGKFGASLLRDEMPVNEVVASCYGLTQGLSSCTPDRELGDAGAYSRHSLRGEIPFSMCILVVVRNKDRRLETCMS